MPPLDVNSEENQSLLACVNLLLAGEYPQGWALYDAHLDRFKRKYSYPVPRWRGEDLAGKSITIEAEQGFGDQIMMVRYAYSLKLRGAKEVYVHCAVPLAELFRSVPGVDATLGDTCFEVGNEDTEVPYQFPVTDYYVPMFALPALFGTTVNTVPCFPHYLLPDLALAQRLNEMICLPETKLLVGVAWQGAKNYALDELRSFHFRELLPLAGVPGVQLVSLQNGPGSEQIKEVGIIDITAFDEEWNDFGHTAALTFACDLVICHDSAIGHLAGALGIPTWLALGRYTEMRWPAKDSGWPFYPKTRLFRASIPKYWGDVMWTIAAELRKSVEAVSCNRSTTQCSLVS